MMGTDSFRGVSSSCPAPFFAFKITLRLCLTVRHAPENVPVGNLSTVPERGADMEVNLLAPCGAKPPATHGGPRQEQKVLFSELLFRPLFHVEMSDTHSLGSPQTEEGQGFPV